MRADDGGFWPRRSLGCRALARLQRCPRDRPLVASIVAIEAPETASVGSAASGLDVGAELRRTVRGVGAQLRRAAGRVGGEVATDALDVIPRVARACGGTEQQSESGGGNGYGEAASKHARSDTRES